VVKVCDEDGWSKLAAKHAGTTANNTVGAREKPE